MTPPNKPTREFWMDEDNLDKAIARCDLGNAVGAYIIKYPLKTELEGLVFVREVLQSDLDELEELREDRKMLEFIIDNEVKITEGNLGFSILYEVGKDDQSILGRGNTPRKAIRDAMKEKEADERKNANPRKTKRVEECG
jgi:hypothetical protein